MSAIIELDKKLFFLINQKMANPVFDWLMPIVTSLKLFLPLLIILAIALAWFGKKRGIIAVICIAIAIGLSDGISSHILKPLIERLRPCVELEGVRMLIGRKTSFSFPSSHAANITAAAVVLSYFYRKALWPAVIVAIMVSFSRIYVGVHYPIDVLAGAIIGVGMSAATIYTYRKYIPEKYQVKKQ